MAWRGCQGPGCWLDRVLLLPPPCSPCPLAPPSPPPHSPSLSPRTLYSSGSQDSPGSESLGVLVSTSLGPLSGVSDSMGKG